MKCVKCVREFTPTHGRQQQCTSCRPAWQNARSAARRARRTATKTPDLTDATLTPVLVGKTAGHREVDHAVLVSSRLPSEVAWVDVIIDGAIVGRKVDSASSPVILAGDIAKASELRSEFTRRGTSLSPAALEDAAHWRLTSSNARSRKAPSDA